MIYRLTYRGKRLAPSDPLHVGNFYTKRRLHRKAMQDRQDLILYLAQLHRSALATDRPRGFCEVQLRLMSLREWVYDYRTALDYFFDVKQLGYSFDAEHNEVSVLVPKVLPIRTDIELVYEPPTRPSDGTVSKVYLQPAARNSQEKVLEKLRKAGRHDLLEPVRWLLRHDEINFIFQPAGRLRRRDTSVWPVAAVETWPSWLREELFGPGIDIDSAYTQFIMQQLKQVYSEAPQLIDILYPDLVKLLRNKVAWRKDLCERTLGLEWNDENISLIKTICMSLANGSKISPGILSAGVGFSITADIIIRSLADISIERVENIGQRLQSISRQYAAAKKVICTAQLRLNPSRSNQKRVFSSYFEWERAARYFIWEGIERHGIMVHDGIDGVPKEHLEKLPELIESIGIQLSGGLQH